MGQNYPLILDGKIFSKDRAWREYCKEHNMPNPFDMIEELNNKYTTYEELPNHGCKVIKQEMSEEDKNRLNELKKYRNEYLTERALFEGQFILKNYGYNELSNFAQTQDPYHCKLIEWLATVKPCEGKDGQCQIFCPIFNQCNNIGD